MDLLSGEVETGFAGEPCALPRYRFRMALLSGEVETANGGTLASACLRAFRMALLSGEVETRATGQSEKSDFGSGWLCYPGKLKQASPVASIVPTMGSGWLCYPGKLKHASASLAGMGSTSSGWLCYPGKLKLRCGVAHNPNTPPEFRMVWLSGEVETGLAVHRRRL